MSSTAATPVRLDPIEDALEALRQGRPVVVIDDEDRENEGDLIVAAELVDLTTMAFMVRWTSGFVCVALPGEDLDRLGLPPMRSHNEDRKGTAYAVTVDAREGVTTGISARDRAHTVRLLADPETSSGDLSRPGHVVPLRAVEGGVLRRAGHTEAAVDLARLSGLRPAGALCELVSEDGSMMRAPECRSFADQHGLVLVSIADLIAYVRRTESQVVEVSRTRMPLSAGLFQAHGYRALVDDVEHMALVHGDIGDGEDLLVRVHSECLTGDVFGSRRCDCGAQLDASLARIVAEGRGVLLYLRGHEGRGIGLLQKLQAYELQDQGLDTVDANTRLGLPADAREYGTGAQILSDLGVRSMRLMTNNPLKRAGLEGFGLRVEATVPLETVPTVDNIAYLTTKRNRMGHSLLTAPVVLPPRVQEIAL